MWAEFILSPMRHLYVCGNGATPTSVISLYHTICEVWKPNNHCVASLLRIFFHLNPIVESFVLLKSNCWIYGCLLRINIYTNIRIVWIHTNYGYRWCSSTDTLRIHWSLFFFFLMVCAGLLTIGRRIGSWDWPSRTTASGGCTQLKGGKHFSPSNSSWKLSVGSIEFSGSFLLGLDRQSLAAVCALLLWHQPHQIPSPTSCAAMGMPATV